MVQLEQLHIPHLPPDLPVFAALFTDVTNGAELKGQLVAGNEEFEYAFVDACVVLSRMHILAAIFRAVTDYQTDRLKSRNVHSEIVFSLSPNKNIGEAFRRFGVSDTTTSLLVVKIATKPGITFDSVREHLGRCVAGQSVPFDDENLRAGCDLGRLRRVYKLNVGAGAGAGAGGSGNAKRNRDGLSVGDKRVSTMGNEDRVDEREIEVLVLGSMALRGAA